MSQKRKRRSAMNTFMKKTRNEGGKCTLFFYKVFIRKTEWFLSNHYFSVFRQNDHKRPHFSGETIGSQQLLNGCSFSASRNNFATRQLYELYDDIV